MGATKPGVATASMLLTLALTLTDSPRLTDSAVNFVAILPDDAAELSDVMAEDANAADERHA